MSGRSWARPSRAVALLAGVAGLIAAAVSHWVFPFGSPDNDEAIYRLQADTVAHGHLFPAAPAVARPFTPWLAALVGHHYVLKYTPLVAGVLGLSRALTGSYLPALAVVAAAAVLTTWALAREVLGREGAALTAAALVAGCPLVIIQSGLLLAYLPALVLFEVFAWAAVRAARSGSARWAWLAGLSLGLTATVRPYDALLVSVPLLVWAWRRMGRGVRPRRLPVAGWWLLGGAGPALGLGLYDQLATGHVFKLPFNLLESSDNVGFGVHRLFPTDLPHHFGLVEGLVGVGNHLALMLIWVAGGPVLVLLAALGWHRALGRRADHERGDRQPSGPGERGDRQPSGPGERGDRQQSGPGERGALVALIGAGVLLAVGYVMFWGAWNAAVLWGGTAMVGPFYFMPLVVPLALLGAEGLRAMARRPTGRAAAVIGLVAVTLAVTIPTMAGDARASRQDGALLALARRAPAWAGGPALVFVPGQDSFVMHPVNVLGNGWRIGGPVAFAAATGTGSDVEAARAMPGRAPFLLLLGGGYSPHPAHPGGRLAEMTMTAGRTVTLTIAAASPAIGGSADSSVLTVIAGDRPLFCAGPDSTAGWHVILTADGSVSCEGGQAVLGPGAVGSGAGPAAPAGAGAGARAGAGDGLRLVVTDDSSPTARPVSVLVAAQADGDAVEVLTTGASVATVGRPPAPVPLSISAQAAG